MSSKSGAFHRPGRIRGVPLKIKREGENWREIENILFSVSRQIQELHNFIWRFWTAWHTERGSDALVRAWMVERIAWQALPKDEKKGKGPNCPVHPWPKEFAEALRKAARDRFPELNDRPLSAVMQKLMQTIFSRNGVNTAFKLWQQILVDKAGVPGYTSPLPIPLDNRRAKLFPPDDSHKEWRVEFRIDRIPGAAGAKASHCCVVTVIAEKWAGTTLRRILAGEYARKGANLVYRSHKHAWFIELCYEEPGKEADPLDPNRVAYVRPCVDRPFEISIAGKPVPIGGTGHGYQASLERVQINRRERSTNYRYAASAIKGHGRERATGKIEALSGAVNRITHNANNHFCRRIIDRCKEERCGKLVIDRRTTKDVTFFLDRIKGQHSWAWAQLEEFLKKECSQLHITLEVLKGEMEDGDD